MISITLQKNFPDFFNEILSLDTRLLITEHMSVKDLFVYGRVSKTQYADKAPLGRIKKFVNLTTYFATQLPEDSNEKIFDKMSSFYKIAVQGSKILNIESLQFIYHAFLCIPIPTNGCSFGYIDKRIRTVVHFAVEYAKCNKYEKAKELFDDAIKIVAGLPSNYNELNCWKNNDIYYLEIADGLFECSFFQDFCMFGDSETNEASVLGHYRFLEGLIVTPKNKCHLLHRFIKIMIKKGDLTDFNSFVDAVDQKLNLYLGPKRYEKNPNLIPFIKKNFSNGDLINACKLLKGMVELCCFDSILSTNALILMEETKLLAKENKFEEAKKILANELSNYHPTKRGLFKVCIQLGFIDLIMKFCPPIIYPTDSCPSDITGLLVTAVHLLKKGYQKEAHLLFKNIYLMIIEDFEIFSVVLVALVDQISNHPQTMEELIGGDGFLEEIKDLIEKRETEPHEIARMYCTVADAFINLGNRKASKENLDLSLMHSNAITNPAFYQERLMDLIQKLAKTHFIDEALEEFNKINQLNYKISALVMIIAALSNKRVKPSYT